MVFQVFNQSSFSEPGGVGGVVLQNGSVSEVLGWFFLVAVSL